MVRKSLVTASPLASQTRYAMLETIRQFAEEQLEATGTTDQIRDRHAAYFGDQAVANWNVWDGPDQRAALDWVDAEFANLRAAFYWATGRGDLVTATALAAHTVMLGFVVQHLEPVGWAEQILDAAATADVPQLPRLYIAAARCSYLGRPDVAVAHAQAALRFEADPRYDPFEPGWAGHFEAIAHVFAGRIDTGVGIYAGLAAQAGSARLFGMCGLINFLPRAGRAGEARDIANATVTEARDHANPFWIAFALYGYGQAFARTDPARALRVWREGIAYTRAHRLPFWEAVIARESAGLEAVHGDPSGALELFDAAIESFHHAGNIVHLAYTLAHLAVFFDRMGRPDITATLYGTSTHQHGLTAIVPELPTVMDRCRAKLGDTLVDQCVAAGAAMEPGDAVAYARDQIQAARRQLADVT
jgi:hypothetical protein